MPSPRMTEDTGDAGNTLAYRRSNKKVSKTSRMTSIVGVDDHLTMGNGYPVVARDQERYFAGVRNYLEAAVKTSKKFWNANGLAKEQ